MADTDFSAEIDSLRHTLASIEQVSDIDRIKADIAELEQDRKSTRLNSSHSGESRMPSSA